MIWSPPILPDFEVSPIAGTSLRLELSKASQTQNERESSVTVAETKTIETNISETQTVPVQTGTNSMNLLFGDNIETLEASLKLMGL